MQSHYRRARKRLDALADTHDDHGPIHPQVTAAAMDRVAADDAVFLADVGTPVAVGGAVPAPERAAPADRLVQPWDDGQRAAPGDRRAGVSPRARRS